MMSRTLRGPVLALSLIVVAACSGAETTDRPAASADKTVPARFLVATGTVIDATLTETISSRQAKVGDGFTARVVHDVLNAPGAVAIPAGSMMHGTIVEVRPAPNANATGTLILAVSGVTVRGETYAVNASIDSLSTVSKGRGIEPVDAARVAGGAAAGAILGRVIGGNATGTIVGGVAGGAAGAVVSIAMKDVDVVLPAGSHLMLTLRERLALRAN